ncbi:ATP-dependent DNA helicase PIF1-like protein [Tanacetum coccineum]
MLRVDLYHNVCDAVTRGDTNAAGLGKRIVLPGTFVGGPRYMMQNYQDVMALCCTYGNPDLFITFTSNPKWPKIGEMLAYFPGQKAHDRREVGTRVFKMKLTELLHDLTKNQIFGATEADQIADIISAELPSPIDDPNGYKAVTDYMLRGPCGKDGRYAPCTTECNCSKRYPKQFYAETVLDEDGYLIYRRRDNKAFAKKGKFTFDNRHVVPHNHYLLLKYQAHFNVEWYNRSKVIKYPELQLSIEQIQNYCLVKIQELLNRNGRSLTDFQDLPHPNPQLLTNIDNRLIREALDFDINKSKLEHETLHPLLNPKQRLIYEQVIESVHNQRGQFYFVYGPGGTGKTFLYNTIIARLRTERKIVLAVASSGGRTAHSRFIIPLELLENNTCGIKQNTHLAEIMKDVQLII